MEHVTQPQQIVFLGALFLVACVVLFVWFWRGVHGGERAEPRAREIINALLDWRPTVKQSPAEITSSSVSAPDKITDIEAVSIPVPDTGIDGGIDWQMPRISAYLNDQEFTVFLARQKTRDGKYRLSANDLYKIVGGNRNEVLDIVRQVRASPDYSNRTPEQEQQRAELGIAARNSI